MKYNHTPLIIFYFSLSFSWKNIHVRDHRWWKHSLYGFELLLLVFQRSRLGGRIHTRHSWAHKIILLRIHPRGSRIFVIYFGAYRFFFQISIARFFLIPNFLIQKLSQDAAWGSVFSFRWIFTLTVIPYFFSLFWSANKNQEPPRQHHISFLSRI